MRKMLIFIWFTLIAIALLYYLQLAYYLLYSYKLTNYGFGLLIGKILILVFGVMILNSFIKIKKETI